MITRFQVVERGGATLGPVRTLTRVLSKITDAFGHPASFLAALLLVVLWAVSYPLWNNFDSYQLAINTATTILTFVGVFAIQNEQNRDSVALHAKLDEVLRRLPDADAEGLVGIEDEPLSTVKSERDRRR
jgi:low affinity Fe/Cu permease